MAHNPPTRFTPQLSFEWRVSSEPLHDVLIFFLDGQLLDVISGSPNWASVQHVVEPGPAQRQTHTAVWCYEKDLAVSADLDQGELRDLAFDQVQESATTATTM